MCTEKINFYALIRWADLNTAGGSNPKAEHYYDHPFFQVCTYMVCMCILGCPYKVMHTCVQQTFYNNMLSKHCVFDMQFIVL